MHDEKYRPRGSTQRRKETNMSDITGIENQRCGFIERENRPNAELALIVDDDDGVLETTAQILLDLGYFVLTAHHGLEALAALQKNSKISVLLTDIQMPGMGGEQLAEIAAALRPGIKVIFTSGCYRAPPNRPFLSKPYRAADLIRVLARPPFMSSDPNRGY
jgi:two-component system, cell cycle response regulator CpdR